MKILYKCKFCQKEGLLTFDGDNPDVLYKREIWLGMAACNRCADYRTDRRRFIDGIKHACESMFGANLTMTGQKLAEKRNKVGSALEHLTKKLTTVVCDHYRMTNVWDVEFPTMLLERPGQWLPIVNQYIKGIATMKKEQP